MARIFVGVSQYAGLRGKSQYSELRAGLQIIMVLALVNAQLPKSEWVYINEATRSRADQTFYWNDYVRRGAPPAVVAARPFRSKHDGGAGDESRAFDLGGPGGSVITARAHALVVSVGAPYGIHWIGKNFRPRELWHFEYVPGTATLLASDGPTQKEEEDEHMTIQLYQHQITGNLATMDMSTGRVWALPSRDWAQQLRNMRQVPDKDPIIMTDGQWKFLLDRCLEAKLDVAERVWIHPTLGSDGTQLAVARLVAAQIDAFQANQGVKNLKLTGGQVDTEGLAARIIAGVQTAVKAMFTNGGK